MLRKRFSIPLDVQISVANLENLTFRFIFVPIFNISHSVPYVVCAVCDISIGINIQKIVLYHSNIATSVFSSMEVEQIESTPNPITGFTRAWTPMEAQAKATGTGIVRKLIYDIFSHMRLFL